MYTHGIFISLSVITFIYFFLWLYVLLFVVVVGSWNAQPYIARPSFWCLLRYTICFILAFFMRKKKNCTLWPNSQKLLPSIQLLAWYTIVKQKLICCEASWGSWQSAGKQKSKFLKITISSGKMSGKKFLPKDRSLPKKKRSLVGI